MAKQKKYRKVADVYQEVPQGTDIGSVIAGIAIVFVAVIALAQCTG